MLCIITDTGRIELQNPELEARLIEKHITANAAAKADREMLAVSYRIDGEPDESLPFGGLLTKRLQCSLRAARDLISSGSLAFYTIGQKKGYRVSERDVLAYENRLKQAS